MLSTNEITVFTVGVFDFFHIGHLRLLNRAKSYGDRLIVAVQRNVKKYKPGLQTVYSHTQRIELVKAIKSVDEVITYNDIDKIIKKVKFDVFIKGEDQTHAGFQRATQFCEEHHKKVIIIPRTKLISSTALRRLIEHIEF